MVLAIDDCLLASEEGNHARRVAMRWCREQGLRAWSRGGEEGGGLGDRPDEAADSGGGNGSAPDGELAGRGAPPRGESASTQEQTASGSARSGRRGSARGEERTGPGPDGRALLRNLVVREGRRTGKLQVRIVTTEGELDAPSLAAALAAELGERLSGVLWTRSRQLAETTAGGETELVWGDAELPERLGELELRISPEAFFQTNTEMAEVLYGIAAEYAALEGWERVYDLYCGTGTIALTLAPRAGEVWGIELVEQAVADAIAAARRNEIANAHFFAGDARLALPELLARAGRPDVLVVDPPRAGLSQKVVRRIIEAAPRRIVYVSCNPTTLAPNAAQLVEAGWTLRKVRPVDMFPQTHHVECVALLERSMAGAYLRPQSLACKARHAPCVLDLLGPRTAQGVSWELRVGFLRDARRHHPRQGDRGRGAPRPGAGHGRGASARARRGAQRRRHDAAARALPGAARLAAGHPGHGARRRGRRARPAGRSASRWATA